MTWEQYTAEHQGYLSLGDSATRGSKICARQRLREDPCNWWKDFGQTHPEEWDVDSGCSALQRPATQIHATQATTDPPRDNGDGSGGASPGKIVLGLVAMVIIGALASRAKLMNRVGDESIYANDKDSPGLGGAGLASDEL